METDSAPHSDAWAEPAASSLLTQRLLRRASQPAGMIDVRQPQQQYARTQGWVTQQFPMLERITARAQPDGDAGDGSALPLATATQKTEPDYASPFSRINIGSDQPSAPAVAPVMQSPAIVAAITPPPQFRISRRASPPVLQNASGPSVAPAGESAAPIFSTANRPVAPDTTDSSVIVVRRNESGNADSAAGVHLASVTQAPTHSDHVPYSGTAQLPLLQAMPQHRAAVISPAPLLSRKAAVAPLNLAQASPLPSIADTLPVVPTTVRINRRQAASSAISPALALAQPARYTPLDAPPATHQAAPLSIRTSASTDSPAIAAIPPDPVTFVWRKASSPAASVPAMQAQPAPAARLEIARQSAPDHDAADMTGNAVPAEAAPAASHSENLPDLDKITEHVSRAILRQLAVERERRGIGS